MKLFSDYFKSLATDSYQKLTSTAKNTLSLPYFVLSFPLNFLKTHPEICKFLFFVMLAGKASAQQEKNCETPINSRYILRKDFVNFGLVDDYCTLKMRQDFEPINSPCLTIVDFMTTIALEKRFHNFLWETDELCGTIMGARLESSTGNDYDFFNQEYGCQLTAENGVHVNENNYQFVRICTNKL